MRTLKILNGTLRFDNWTTIAVIFGRQERAKTFVGDLPLVKVFANWASNPNANQAGTALCADAAVYLATGLRALKSEPIRFDARFNRRRKRRATSGR
jgi:hypothetical protein